MMAPLLISDKEQSCKKPAVKDIDFEYPHGSRQKAVMAYSPLFAPMKI